MLNSKRLMLGPLMLTFAAGCSSSDGPQAAGSAGAGAGAVAGSAGGGGAAGFAGGAQGGLGGAEAGAAGIPMGGGAGAQAGGGGQGGSVGDLAGAGGSAGTPESAGATGGSAGASPGGAAGAATAGAAGAMTSGAGGAGGGVGGAEPMPPAERTECPAAPPAEQKDPAADRNLVVSKDAYRQLMTEQEPFVGTRGQLPWHSYAPAQAAAAPQERFPLVVVLHGGYGREVEDGNILVDVAQYMLGSAGGLLTEANLQAYPTYIVAPHCRVEEGCDFGSNEWASAGGAHFQVQAQPSVAGGTAIELIQHVIETLQVDPARVYLTGNSMGGGGTWEFAQRHPELFAAVVPVSGHTPSLDLLATIADAKLPVWAFGAVNDTTNPYADTVEAIASLSDAGGCAWLTTYNNAGHDDALWSSPYLEPGLWPWLFAQSNPTAP